MIIYVYVYIYMYDYLCIHIYIYIKIYLYSRCVCIYVCMCMYIYIYTHLCSIHYHTHRCKGFYYVVLVIIDCLKLACSNMGIQRPVLRTYHKSAARRSHVALDQSSWRILLTPLASDKGAILLPQIFLYPRILGWYFPSKGAIPH